MDVAGVGLGCTLIKRRVMEAIDFRLEPTQPDVHNDWVFGVDVQAGRFSQKCDLGVICGHISMTPVPRVIWPDLEAPRMYRNDFIRGIPLNERGELELEIGQLGEFEVTMGDLIQREVRPESLSEAGKAAVEAVMEEVQ
jgi:hypothetical protein